MLKTGLAFFYCLHSDGGRRISENIFASIVKQLAAHNELSFSALLGVYSNKESAGFLSAQLTLEECQHLIQDMSASYSRLVIILDALDECYADDQGEILAAFHTLIESGIPVKVLVSSRPNPDIRVELEEGVHRSILATDNSEDIMEYARHRLRKFQLSKRAIRHAKEGNPLIPCGLENKIVATIRKRSQGM